VGARTAHVLIAESERGFVDPQREALVLHTDSVLAAVLGESTGLVDVSAAGALRHLLPPRERQWVTANGLELAAALKRRDGSVAALVAVAMRGGAAFDARTRSLVMALLTAASAAWSDETFGAGPGERSRSAPAGEPGHSSDPGDLTEAAFEC